MSNNNYILWLSSKSTLTREITIRLNIFKFYVNLFHVSRFYFHNVLVFTNHICQKNIKNFDFFKKNCLKRITMSLPIINFRISEWRNSRGKIFWRNARRSFENFHLIPFWKISKIAGLKIQLHQPPTMRFYFKEKIEMTHFFYVRKIWSIMKINYSFYLKNWSGLP